jgi:multiple sugar transport system ATP-binding protein
MVAGLEEISDGVIRIGDRVVNDVPPKNRDIAMVFQNYALYPHMSVYKNMAFGLKLRGMPKAQIQQRVNEAAKILEIEHLLERKPKALSGGQRQRVAVGRAIVREPAAFLFDEPLSNLDAKLRVTTRAELKRLHQRLRTTTIYVTHDQEEAMTLGDRIVVMKDGFIQQCAPPLEVYDRPVNRFVASFVGTPPMNFLQGQLMQGPYFMFGQQRLKLAPRMAELVGGYIGKEMVLGVRPETFSPGNEGKYHWEENAIDAKVNVIEPLGDKVDIYVSTEGHDHLVCRTDAHQFGKLTIGDTIKLHLDLGRVHLFEPGENGVNVTLQREPAHAAA